MNLEILLKCAARGACMKKKFYIFFLATCSLSSLANDFKGFKDIEASHALKTTNATGNWSTSSIWTASGIPGSADDVIVNHSLILDRSLNFSTSYIFNKSVTDLTGGSAYELNLSNNATLDVRANATFEGGMNVPNTSSVVVRSGFTLIVGPLTMGNSSSLTIESGATLIVNGDFNASNSVPIVSEGVIQINGNYRASNSVGITGNGEFFTTGVLFTSNSAKAFGSELDCNAGPCSGRNLCTYTNSLSTTTPIICPGATSAVITGTSNSTSPSILWEISTTSNATVYTTATAPNTAANYSPGVLNTTTWYRRTMVAASCTTKAIQQITVNSAPAIISQPLANNNCIGNNAAFTVAVTSATTPTYQWQVYNGTAWSNISSTTGGYSNYTSATLNITAAAIELNNYQYRCIISNTCASSTSDAAVLTLNSSGYWVGGTGNWNSTTGWCGGLPSSSKDIIINSGAVTIDIATASCRNITINSPGSLILNGSNALSVYGNWTGNNNLNQTGGTIFLSGATAQTINGSNSFKNLTISNTSGGVTIPTGTNKQTITGALTLTSGTLTTNGNLIIDFGNGGAIAGTGTGSIVGNVVTVRVVGSGWHYIGAPLDNLTYNDINNNIALNHSNFYTYQESIRNADINAGWISHTEALTTSLSSQKDAGGPSDMVGYALAFPTNTTFTLTGNYTHGKTYSTGNLAFTNSGVGSADGWHMISNPYPSYIDWNSALGWTKTGITGPITYYDVSKGQNVDYIPASGGQPEIAINGGSPFIPPMQAFWIQTISNSASININNNARLINPSITSYSAPSFYRLGNTETKSLKILVKSHTSSDETAVRFGGKATEEFDYGIDSYKFKNDAKCPSIYTVDHQAEYSVNSLPMSDFGKKINLNFEAGTSGTFTISLKEVKNVDQNTVAILEDTHLEIFQNLTKNPEYTYAAEVGDEPGRFILSFENEQGIEKITTAHTATITANNTAINEEPRVDITGNQHDVKIHFYHQNNDNADVYIYNMAGHEIYKSHHAAINSGLIDIKLNHAHSGMYIVKVVTGQVSHSEKIHLL